MTNISGNRYYIFFLKKKISFQALNGLNKVILIKEILINDNPKNIESLIEDFLEKNIFEIEKDLKDFIKEIIIIFESDLFFNVGSSIKHNFQKIKIELNNLNDTLFDIRNQFKKCSPENEIIHMTINKYILDGINYEILPKDINSQNLSIQVNFICLKDQIVKDFKKIFYKYQISVNRILSYQYLEGLRNQNNNIFELADSSINGLGKNEVSLVVKTTKNLGFFEKFFNLFS